MKNLQLKCLKRSPLTGILMAAAFLLVLWSPPFVKASDLEDIELDLPKGDGFVYSIENRADPFVPFISEKATTVEINMNEIVDDSGPLTGMQLFEPGQLNLVALMRTGGRDVAMVEDFSGKGYVLTEGMKIGRRGVVMDIAANSVLIEETARTRAGKEIVTKVVMTLKKEEGER